MFVNRGCQWMLAMMLSFLLVATACQRAELYHDLNEEDANEMLVLLMQHHIEAKKVRETKQNQVSWTIQVEPAKIGEARELLVQQNLPRHREPGMKDVYSKQGLIPTPDEQKARYLMALKGEIINSLETIPDVVTTDVVLNVPSPEEFTSDKEVQRPTASVVIKVRPTEQAMANLTEAKIQRFVANAVEKLDPRDVAVIITYTSPQPQGVMPGQALVLPSSVIKQPTKTPEGSKEPMVSVAGIEVSAHTSRRLKVYLVLFLMILATLSLGLVATILQAVRMRREQKAKGPERGAALPAGTAPGQPPRLGPGGG